jgi:lambda family phage portal protein
MASNLPTILDQHGNPLTRMGAVVAHDAADRLSQELANWVPFLSSADAEILPERETIAARVHDIARNDGWASGALTKHLDSVIGAGLTLSARPDWRALGQSPEWAAEWSREVEALWRGYADDPDFWCDAARQSTMAGVFGRLYRHRLLDGEALALLLWEPARGGRWASTVQVVDPDRLSNPNERPDEAFLRGGVELDRLGAARAYHIRAAHPGDFFGLVAAKQFRWERVLRETPFGRPMVVHDFEAERAGQTRARPPLAPILKKLKMLSRYDGAELGAAVINAIFAAFIESPFDHEFVAGALDSSQLTSYQDQRRVFHDESRNLHLGAGARIPVLFPGERFNFPSPARPNTSYPDFTKALLRNVATAMGLSYEQLSMDWSQTNYSSARAALLEVWKFMQARGGTFKNQTCCQIYGAWLEEAIDRGDVETPPGAPDFLDAKAAYIRCRWIGPGRGWVDPVKEAQAAVLRMEAGLSTLQQEAAEQGLDWEEVLEQRKREIEMMDDLGLPRLDWATAQQMTDVRDREARTKLVDQRTK